MVKVGDIMYGLRVVSDYDGHYCGKEPIFNGFEGYIVWNTWDTGDIQVLYSWKENGELCTDEIGYIDDNEFKEEWTGKQLAEFIKIEVSKMNVVDKEGHRVTAEEVRQRILESGIIATRNIAAKEHISRKNFNALIEEIQEYINEQIDIAIQPLGSMYLPPIAIDETIAMIIELRDITTTTSE